MSDLMAMLYQYAGEMLVPKYLESNEYHQALDEVLALHLADDPAMPPILEKLTDLNLLEMEAMFQASLALGMELGRISIS